MASQGEVPLTLLVSSGFVGGLVLLSYAIVLFDVAGFFTLPLPPTNGYLNSHYWLGMPTDTVSSVVILQACAAVGAVGWFIWLVTTPKNSLQNSILNSETTQFVLIQLFLWSSLLWPLCAYYYITSRTTLRALLACTPLWTAAISTLLLIGGSFEAGCPPLPMIGILALGVVVVLCDATGWAAVCIRSTLK